MLSDLRMSSPGTVFDIYLCDDAPGSSRWKDMLGEEYLRFHELSHLLNQCDI